MAGGKRQGLGEGEASLGEAFEAGPPVRLPHDAPGRPGPSQGTLQPRIFPRGAYLLPPTPLSDVSV